MTTPATTRKAGPLLGNGVTNTFPFAFKVFDAGDIKVTIANSAGVETVLSLGTHYSVAPNANQDTSPGGTVTYPISGAKLPTGSVLVIVGDLDYDQPLDLPTGGNFSPLALENQLDRSTMQIQQLREEMDRTARLPVTSAEDADALIADITRLADSADNLDTVAGAVDAVNTVATDIADVNTVASVAGQVTAIGANLAAVVAVGNDLLEPVSEVDTVANSIANVNTVGSNIASVTAVAGIAGSVTTVAGMAADVAAVADMAGDVSTFADIYQGAKAADPALRNDGSALQAGDLYFNTAEAALRAYSGTQWVAGTAGTVSVQPFSGDGTTTVFTLATAPSDENNTQVFIGGVYQQKSQYSVAGTALTFSEAPPAGTSNVEVVTIASLALGETDATLVNFTQAGTGAVERTAQDKLREFVSPEDFGAVGNGTANDTAAVTAAIATGKRVVGDPKKTYAVSGNITLPTGADLQDIRFKQLTHTGGDRRTLYANSVSGVKLRRVAVDRNGDGTYGSMNGDSGIWISGGSGHLLEDVEVFGDDMGNGITIVGATDFVVTRPYIHDIDYSLGSNPGDDRVQGLYLLNCSGFTVSGQRIQDLGGNYGSGYTTRYSRGLSLGGCSDFTIGAGVVQRVDQGYDVTGSGGNHEFTFSGAHAVDCYTYGFKGANTPINGTYIGCTAKRCGYASFVANGAAENGLPSARYVTFIACKSIDVGSNGAWTANNPTGFLVLQGAFDLTRPRPVRFIACEATDGQTVKTMKYGFRNQVAATAYGQPMNECINCISENHTIAAFSGFAFPACKVKLSAAQSISNNTTTNINWTAEQYDGAVMHDTGSNTDQVRVPRPGWYRVAAQANFLHNGAAAGGLRSVYIAVAGVLDTLSQVSIPAPGNDVTLRAEGTYWLTPDTAVTAQVWQNSGGTISVHTGGSYLEVVECLPHGS